MTSRAIAIGGTSYPLILPNIRDPRLHVAAVIISIHVLGQLTLGFRVSVPQILAAILASAILEIVITFAQTRSFVWPASAMLTGSGVALILRVPSTPPGDHWTTHKWYVFAGVAGFSLATKYLVRYRGSHVFNPSNIGLVLTFVVLGSTRVEPLDFWWAPIDTWGMIAAYTIIIGGGLLITRRLRLLELAGTYWIGLAVGLAILAGSGHCMTANWAFSPVCGYDFWRVVVFSPEVMIFLFFMITDPKTVPSGRVGRVAFGLLVALASVFMMAPQIDEFGTKVALLASLVVVCAVRPVLDRLVPEPRSAADDLAAFAKRLAVGSKGGVRRVGRVAVLLVLIFVTGAGIVAAGASARGVVVAGADGVISEVPHTIDPATFPEITVESDVTDWNHEIAGAGAQEVLLTLAENLELENQALLRSDDGILTAVDHGDRLDEMRDRLSDAQASGSTVVSHYLFDAVNVDLIVPFGVQTGLSLGLESQGTVTTETYDEAGVLQDRESAPFDLTFVMRRATGDRWLNVAVLPADAGD